MRKVILFSLTGLFVYAQLVSAANALNIGEELQKLYEAGNEYPVKKHLKLAIDFNNKGMLKSLRCEVRVLKEIDSKSAGVYKKILDELKLSIREIKSPTQKKARQYKTAKGVKKDYKGKSVIGDKLERAYNFYSESKLNETKMTIEEILGIDKDNEEAKELLADMKKEQYKPEENKPFQNIMADLFDEGMRFYRKGNYKAAGEKLQKALETDPTNKQAGHFINIVERKLSEVKEAEEVAQLLDAADRLRNDGKISKARKLYDRAVKIKPGNKRAEFYIKEFNEKSIKAYKSAVEQFNNQKFKDSYDSVNTALDYNAKNNDAAGLKKKLKMKLAVIRKEEKDKREANKLYNRGVTAFSKGEYKEAISLWQEVLSINPDDAEAKKNIKVAEEKMGEEGKKKKKEIKQALEDAQELFEQGLIDKSKGKYEYVLRVDPGNKAAKSKIDEINELKEKQKTNGMNKR